MIRAIMILRIMAEVMLAARTMEALMEEDLMVVEDIIDCASKLNYEWQF
jgi:hypothetical protein